MRHYWLGDYANKKIERETCRQLPSQQQQHLLLQQRETLYMANKRIRIKKDRQQIYEQISLAKNIFRDFSDLKII